MTDLDLLPPRLRAAISQPPNELDQLDDRDAMLTLLEVQALHLSPLELLGGAEVWQHEPRVATVKAQLERRFLDRLGIDGDALYDLDAVAAMRRIARDDLVPSLYDWLAEHATHDELVRFLAVEGGPDADFDDLVAIGQIGLVGLPKLTLAVNYWDEMGRGDLGQVHTELHRDMVDALDMPRVPLDELPLAALDRKALNGVLATNRALQPELLGSLGLLECQAGPRCRRIVQAMRRCGVPVGAFPFYAVHADADPIHGRDWLDGAVKPLVEDRPDWAPRIVRGARWRSAVNRRFFAHMEQELTSRAVAAA